MFLTLNHRKLDIYLASKLLVVECYRLSNLFPTVEKFGMVSQISRAVLSLHLNISEGASRKSKIERKRFYEIARGSLVEIDAAFDIANSLGYLKNYSTKTLEVQKVKCFKMLTGLINS